MAYTTARRMMSARRFSPLQRALRAALATRRRLNIGFQTPVCIYDIAELMGVEVRFHPATSMEGLYASDVPAIFVSAERPFGRQAFTCAHELGHHVFGHGSRVDELRLDRKQNVPRKYGRPIEEQIADLYAGFLLMPKLAVQHIFARRGYDLKSLVPRDIFLVASHLGVGYSSLLHHASSVLKLLSPRQASTLRKTSPREIRSEILGRSISEDLWVLDENWWGRPLDVQVGDVLLVPHEFFSEAKHLVECGSYADMLVLKAISAGVTSIVRVSQEPVEVRIARRKFTGRSRYRHLEE